MAGYFWFSGPDSGNNTVSPTDGGASLVTLDALGGMDIFDFSYKINPANFTLTKSVDGSVTLSGASSGHNLNVKLVNFETIAYSGTNLSIAGINAGTAGNDIITGTAFKDVINGGGGNDTLSGNIGKDTLTGGAGSDKFTFNSALNSKTNVDTIKDYDAGGVLDRVQLDDDFFKAIGTGTTAGVALTASNFYVGAAAHDANDHIIYNKTTGALLYDADGSGAGAAIQFAVVGSTVHPTLNAGDFFVIA